jgi:hypothetical protein
VNEVPSTRNCPVASRRAVPETLDDAGQGRVGVDRVGKLVDDEHEALLKASGPVVFDPEFLRKPTIQSPA